ncbi:hypothetical protein HERIO_618 [Hepatospora eriocheir]|uniref:Uncharacterized protein n=1 Tax=Hepatospora eriocheir TaxID=1081669 RepID=A0A1X0QD00_9MICR|nr:hypothetical protein HERIO_618 [Hepatospora eriocheir]
MEIITKVVGEVLKQFCGIFYFEITFILIIIDNTIKNDEEIELFKIIYFLLFVIILFCIVIGLFASNNRIRSIVISITGVFLILELCYFILFLIADFKIKKFFKNKGTKRFIDILTNENEIKSNVEDKDFFKIMILNIFFNMLGVILEDSILIISSCVELTIYIIIFIFSNRLISIDKTLIFLVLTILSLKTCFKSFYDDEEKGMCTCLKITDWDIFNLISFTILFILSSYVKLVRDILVNLILSVFYSIILSLFISIIYYERDDLLNRFKQLLKDDNKKDFSPPDEEIRIEFIFMGCFILYLITIFLTWRLFWKKKTIVKMNY